MGRYLISHIVAALLATGSLAGPLGASAPTAAPATDRPEGIFDPLAAGQQFAARITMDDKDRAKMFGRLCDAYLERGDLIQALTCMRRMEDWRKGVALADIAAWLAERGRADDARSVLEQARRFSATITGWQHDRIEMHIVRAEAVLGLEDRVADARTRYAGNRDVEGQAAAYHALALARTDRADEAFEVLGKLADDNYLDTQMWRAQGYLLLARDAGVGANDRARAAERAWEASDVVPGWKKWEYQLDIVRDAVASGDREKAPDLLGRTSAAIRAAGLPGHIKVPLMARTAVLWGRLGRTDQVNELLDIAEPLIASDLQAIERPEVYALWGEAFAAAEDKVRALTFFKQSAAITLGLVNPRPRALACIDLCLALERSGFRGDEMRESLEHLLGTFEHAKD